MAELERELRVLGALVELPPERDLVPGVSTRLAVRPRRRPWRALALALAVLAVALGVAFAVPPARSAILRFLGLESVTIIRVEKLPPVGPGPAAFGDRVSLQEAERRVGFRPLLPDIGRPDEVYVDQRVELVILLYGKPGPRLRLSERLTMGGGLLKKLATGTQLVEPVGVDGAPGLWIKGPHVVYELAGQPRLSGSVLLWERNGLLLRLEGRLTKEEALRIARSVR